MSKHINFLRKSKFSYVIPSFTLAEVLITLGIVGIIAAMTLPSVIGNAQKKATASKVHKFYNTMNNALQFAIAENGDVSEWMGEPRNLTYQENLEFFRNYFGKHIKYNRYDNCFEWAVCIYTETGGMFMFRYDVNGGDIFYFVNGKQEDATSRNAFSFQFNKIDGMAGVTRVLNRKTTIEPYVFDWNGTYEQLITHSIRGCRKNVEAYGNFCAKLLQLNNWEFPKDYLW